MRNANLFHSFSACNWASQFAFHTIHQNSPKTSGVSLFRLFPADMSSDQSPAYAVHRWDYMGLYNTVLYGVHKKPYKDLWSLWISDWNVARISMFPTCLRSTVHSLSWHKFAVTWSVWQRQDFFYIERLHIIFIHIFSISYSFDFFCKWTPRGPGPYSICNWCSIGSPLVVLWSSSLWIQWPNQHIPKHAEIRALPCNHMSTHSHGAHVHIHTQQTQVHAHAQYKDLSKKWHVFLDKTYMCIYYSRWKVVLTLHLILPHPPHHHQLFHHRPPNICFLLPKCLAQLHFFTQHSHTSHSISLWLYSVLYTFFSSLCKPQ